MERVKMEEKKQNNSAGRTLLLVTSIVTFITGTLGGWLIASGKGVKEEDLLSKEVYLIGIGDSPSLGPDTAAVTIVEWNDMKCKSCIEADKVLRKAVDLYPGEVRVVWKNALVDSESEESMISAQSAMAASYAGEFWKMKDKISAWENKIDIATIRNFAQDIGMDPNRLEEDITRGVYKKRVEVDLSTKERIGITRIPTIFINGRLFIGEVTVERIKSAIDIELPKARNLISQGVSPAQVYWEIIRKGKTSIQPPTTSPVEVPQSPTDGS